MKILGKEVVPGMVARIRDGDTRMVEKVTEATTPYVAHIRWVEWGCFEDYREDGVYFGEGVKSVFDIVGWVEPEPTSSPGYQGIVVQMSQALFDEICKRKWEMVHTVYPSTEERVNDAKKEVAFVDELNKVFK